MKNKSRVLAIGLLVSAFGVGTAFGGVVSTAWSDDDDRGRRNTRERYSEMMARELGLTDTQRDSVARILESSRPEMCAIWEEYRPRYESLRGTIRSQIRELLDDEQRGVHEELMARHDSVRASRRSASDSTGKRNGC